MQFEELKKKFEGMVLMNPIVMEAVDTIGRGVQENVAFCWAAVKLVEENESMKVALAGQRKHIALLEELASTYKEIYHQRDDTVRSQLAMIDKCEQTIESVRYHLSMLK